MANNFYVWEDEAEKKEAIELAEDLLWAVAQKEELKDKHELLKEYPKYEDLRSLESFYPCLRQIIRDQMGPSRWLGNEEMERSRELFAQWSAKIRQALFSVLREEKERVAEQELKHHEWIMAEAARKQREFDMVQDAEDGVESELTTREWEKNQREARGLTRSPNPRIK